MTAYIDAVEEPARTRLRTLRGVIRAAAPDAVERIAWGMPTWHQGENLLHAAAFRRHIGIYPGAAAIVAFADDLGPYKTSKGAIQLPHGAPLPKELVAHLTRFRVQEATRKAQTTKTQKKQKTQPAKTKKKPSSTR